MAEMRKRPAKRVLLAVLMITMLMCTVSLTAEQETGGGEETSGAARTSRRPATASASARGTGAGA